jgi:hypothetical protein
MHNHPFVCLGDVKGVSATQNSLPGLSWKFQILFWAEKSGTRSRKGTLKELGLGSLRNSGILTVYTALLSAGHQQIKYYGCGGTMVVFIIWRGRLMCNACR